MEASTAVRQREVTASKTMLDRTIERFCLYPERIAGDTAYGSGEMLDWLVNERGIEPHVPVFDKSRRTDDTFSRDDFTYDHDGDAYFCPGGNTLAVRETPVAPGATRHAALALTQERVLVIRLSVATCRKKACLG